eukprot:COSAG01_NODE_1735_length_9365_cov_3.816318_7_plen_58_part_00
MGSIVHRRTTVTIDKRLLYTVQAVCVLVLVQLTDGSISFAADSATGRNAACKVCYVC